MSQNEEHSTQNRDWDDMSPDTKQRFQELARKDTEHRTEYDESLRYPLFYRQKPKNDESLHDDLCAISDLLDLEEDYTND